MQLAMLMRIIMAIFAFPEENKPDRLGNLLKKINQMDIRGKLVGRLLRLDLVPYQSGL